MGNKEYSISKKSFEIGLIDDLIFDQILRDKQYQIYFLVDTYDIIEYFFPFKIRNEKNKKNEQEFLETRLAYHYLFYDYKYKPIIPNEYINELVSFKYYLKKQLERGKEAYAEFKKFLEEPGAEYGKDKVKFLRTNIRMILALSLDLLTPKSIREFDEFTKSRLNIFDIDLLQSEDEEPIKEIFKEAARSNKTKIIFQEYFEETKYELIRMDITKRERYLDNAIRDIIVIDRCLQINKRIVEELSELSGKYLFLYLSSTPVKSKNLFNLQTVKAEQSRIIFPEKLPEKQTLNLLRNSYQLLIQSTMDLDENNGKLYLDSLNEFKETKKREKSLEKFIAEENNFEGHKTLEVTANQSRKLSNMIKKRIFDQAKISKFFKYKDLIENTINNASEKKDVSVLKKFFSEITEDKFNSGADAVLSYLMIHNQNINIYTKLLEILSSYSDAGTTVIIPEGKDVIRSHYQTFPILLFYQNQNKLNNSNYRDLVDHIGDFLSDPEKLNKAKGLEFVENITDLVENLLEEGKRGSSSTLLNIVLLYLNIIFPVVKTDKNGPPNLEDEEQLIRRLERLLYVTRKTKIETEVENQRLEIIHLESEYVLEIYYILVWLYRRQGLYQKSIELCEEIFSDKIYNYKASNVVRFKHGKVLADLCILYENIEQMSLGEMESKLLDSLHCIDEIIITYKENKVNILVSKTIIALQNGSCDILLKLYEKTNKMDYLSRAEYLTEQLKKAIKSTKNKNGKKYTIREFPAFSDTISWLFVHKANSTNNHEDRLEYKKLALSYWKSCEQIYTGKMFYHGQRLKEAIKNIHI